MKQSFFSLISNLPCGTVALRDGERLFRQSQKPKDLYFVESGRVRLERQLKDGAVAVMHVARQDDWVAEGSLFHERYHCDAIAEGPTTLRVLKKQSVLVALTRKPALCLSLAEEMALRLRDVRAR